MNYTIKIKKSAEKEIDKLLSKIHQRVSNAIVNLEKNARPVGSQKLHGSSDGYRIRVGNYRIIYTINDKNKIVEISDVGHRKEVYR
ncbi:MAG TPA: type II toxin-antitoxin system mRNA interferase toxin, RelE/StbE family [Elusimicrobia bacterium]|nr:type II toxin-antitoxin system mRNA interferase toxin, RelE/StbE family [Elusimicrobiota bacterium]